MTLFRFLAASLCLAAAAAGAEPGQPAPAWHLTTLDGRQLSSEQFKGKVVIIDFWATWCAPCKKEIPGYIALQAKYGAQGLAVIGVSVDGGPDPVRRYVKSAGINYEVGMQNDEIYRAFNMPDAIPTTFLIGRDGIVRDMKTGGEPASVYERKVVACLDASGG